MVFSYCPNYNMGCVSTLLVCFIIAHCNIPAERWIHFFVCGFYGRSRFCIELVYALCPWFPEFLQVLLKSPVMETTMGHVHCFPKVIAGLFVPSLSVLLP